MFMKGRLHGELFGLDPAIFLGIVLVDELDGEDWIIGMERRCFLDARLSVSGRRARRASLRTSIMYHAYAPEPIVLDTSLKGTWVGNGASCECGIEAVMISTLSHMHSEPNRPLPLQRKMHAVPLYGQLSTTCGSRGSLVQRNDV